MEIDPIRSSYPGQAGSTLQDAAKRLHAPAFEGDLGLQRFREVCGLSEDGAASLSTASASLGTASKGLSSSKRIPSVKCHPPLTENEVTAAYAEFKAKYHSVTLGAIRSELESNTAFSNVLALAARPPADVARVRRPAVSTARSLGGEHPFIALVPSNMAWMSGGGGCWMIGRTTPVTEMTGPKFSLNRNGEGVLRLQVWPGVSHLELGAADLRIFASPDGMAIGRQVGSSAMFQLRPPAPAKIMIEAASLTPTSTRLLWEAPNPPVSRPATESQFRYVVRGKAMGLDIEQEAAEHESGGGGQNAWGYEVFWTVPQDDEEPPGETEGLLHPPEADAVPLDEVSFCVRAVDPFSSGVTSPMGDLGPAVPLPSAAEAILREAEAMKLIGEGEGVERGAPGAALGIFQGKSEDHSLRDALFNEDTEKQMPQLFSKIQDALSGLALDERQVADLSKALGIMARSGGKVSWTDLVDVIVEQEGGPAPVQPLVKYCEGHAKDLHSALKGSLMDAEGMISFLKTAGEAEFIGHAADAAGREDRFAEIVETKWGGPQAFLEKSGELYDSQRASAHERREGSEFDALVQDTGGRMAVSELLRWTADAGGGVQRSPLFSAVHTMPTSAVSSMSRSLARERESGDSESEDADARSSLMWCWRARAPHGFHMLEESDDPESNGFAASDDGTSETSDERILERSTRWTDMEGKLSECLRWVEGDVFTVASTAVVLLNVIIIVREILDEPSTARWPWTNHHGTRPPSDKLDRFRRVCFVLDQACGARGLDHSDVEISDHTGGSNFGSAIRILRLLRLLRLMKVLKALLQSDLEWVEEDGFQGFVLFAILLNSILLGLQTDMPDFFLWNIFEGFLLLIFSFEIVVRIKHHGRDFFLDCQEVFWNMLDLLIVVSAVIDNWLFPIVDLIMVSLGSKHGLQADSAGMGIITLLRVVRLFRILRLARLIHSLPPLQDLVCGVVQAMHGMFWVLVLTCLMLFCSSILAMTLIEKEPLGRP
eukprot:g15810.t1